MKPSALQSPTWKGLVGLAVAPLELPIVALTAIGEQLVGLRVKLGRSIRAVSERSRSGTPSRISGSGSVLTVTWVVSGLTKVAALTTTLPRSKGPATAGVMKTKETGAPL